MMGRFLVKQQVFFESHISTVVKEENLAPFGPFALVAMRILKTKTETKLSYYTVHPVSTLHLFPELKTGCSEGVLGGAA